MVVFPVPCTCICVAKAVQAAAGASFFINIPRIKPNHMAINIDTKGHFFVQENVCSSLCASDIFWDLYRSAFGSPKHMVFVSSMSAAAIPVPPTSCVRSARYVCNLHRVKTAIPLYRSGWRLGRSRLFVFHPLQRRQRRRHPHRRSVPPHAVAAVIRVACLAGGLQIHALRFLRFNLLYFLPAALLLSLERHPVNPHACIAVICSLRLGTRASSHKSREAVEGRRE